MVVPHTINVSEILQSPFAISSDEGEVIHHIINENFKENKPVVLDFKDIELIVSPFLNSSIGQLYGKYTSDFIKTNFAVLNMSDDDLNTLKLVIDTAKTFFADKDKMSNTLNEHFPDGE